MQFRETSIGRIVNHGVHDFNTRHMPLKLLIAQLDLTTDKDEKEKLLKSIFKCIDKTREAVDYIYSESKKLVENTSS